MQQQQSPSWWVGTTREAFKDEAVRRFPEMAKSAEARGVDPLQGIRQSPPKTGARSAIRLES